jgi:magnesium transporter
MAANTIEDLTFESAARLMTSDVPVVQARDTMASVRDVLAARRYEFAGNIAVCDGDALAGLLKVEDALSAPADALVDTFMDRDPPVVYREADQEVAAWKAVQHGEGALVVVDGEGNFSGLIPPQRLLGILLEEHDEDMARLGGFLRGSSSARQASTEPTMQRLLHRLPWLLVGLAGALVAAIIVDGFEESLREEVLLAFFMPGVVYLSDAVGTQTEALVIRGLSVGVSIRQVVAREVLTGLAAGALLGAAFFPIGLLWWRETDIVLTVSLSLFVACSLATIVATSLPWLFSIARRDPAFGSGPLATVIQDLLSILLYLSIASVLV